MMIQMGIFVVLSGVIIFVAWLSTIGRVAYTMVMLWIAAALAFALLDLIGYEIARKERRRD
jgi:amino acid transporter